MPLSLIPTDPPTLAERYRRLYLGVVYDALCFDLEVKEPFVVHRAVKPIYPVARGQAVAGQAFTCKGKMVEKGAIDDTVRIRMFKSFTRGCVQVIDCDGDDTVAHFGDISGKLARKFGAVGAVIDGYSRDVAILRDDRFQVFCRGSQPVDAYARWQITEYETPITLAGPDGPVAVAPGDFVFGDDDGVIVIPQHLAARVCELAEARNRREDTVRRELAEESDIQALYDRVGRW